MDAFCHPLVERVTIRKSARIGWTKVIGHIMGYHIHQDPCSMLVVQPTIEDAEGYSKEEVQPMIEETPELLSRVGSAKSRDSGNTITKKRYPGGIMHIIGANSPRGFRRITVRLVLFDEVDGYPATAGSEGDQIKLGEKRSETFWNRKIGIGSTPTIKDMSRVDLSYKKSSKGYLFLKCPECGGEHIRLFRQPDEPIILRDKKVKVSHLHWPEGETEKAAWACPENGCLIGPEKHREMMSDCRWIGEHWEWSKETGFVFHPGFDGHIGMSIWAGYSYSPNSTPSKLAKEFIDVSKDHEQLKTFVNTVLGETWEEKGETVSSHFLLDRREEYKAEVPEGVKVLTMGVDVQGDRIEYEVTGWGEGEESWNVDYRTLYGDPSQDEVWLDLEDAIDELYEHESGEMMPISAIGIDSGYLSSKVYSFVLKQKKDYIFALKGEDGAKRPVVETTDERTRRLRKRKRRGGKIRPEIVGTHEAKMLLYRRLTNVTTPGPGYCHFPMERNEEYFEQLTAEKLVKKIKNGRVFLEWVKKRPRNEALDNRNYAYAALLLIDFDLDDPVEMIADDAPAKEVNHYPVQHLPDDPFLQ